MFGYFTSGGIYVPAISSGLFRFDYSLPQIYLPQIATVQPIAFSQQALTGYFGAGGNYVPAVSIGLFNYNNLIPLIYLPLVMQTGEPSKKPANPAPCCDITDLLMIIGTANVPAGINPKFANLQIKPPLWPALPDRSKPGPQADAGVAMADWSRTVSGHRLAIKQGDQGQRAFCDG